jgi:hypothetical protein
MSATRGNCCRAFSAERTPGGCLRAGTTSEEMAHVIFWGHGSDVRAPLANAPFGCRPGNRRPTSDAFAKCWSLSNGPPLATGGAPSRRADDRLCPAQPRTARRRRRATDETLYAGRARRPPAQAVWPLIEGVQGTTHLKLAKAGFGNSPWRRPLLAHQEIGGTNGSCRFVVAAGNPHSHPVADVGVRLAPLSDGKPGQVPGFSVCIV